MYLLDTGKVTAGMVVVGTGVVVAIVVVVVVVVVVILLVIGLFVVLISINGEGLESLVEQAPLLTLKSSIPMSDW